MEATDTIEGYYVNSIIRNYQSGYTIFRVNTGTSLITCSGEIIEPNQGMPVTVSGEWKDTAYGKQLTGCSVNPILTDSAGMIEYLKEIPTIGERLAEALVDKFGSKLYDIAAGEDGVNRISQIPGITVEKAVRVCENIKNTKVLRDLFELITKNGGRYSTVRKIYKAYGNASIEEIKKNPYILSMEFNMQFTVCDQIAEQFGMTALSPSRIAGGIHTILQKYASQGHTYAMYSDITEDTLRLLHVSRFEEDIASACIHCVLMTDERFVLDDTHVYLRYLHHDERRTEKALKQIMKTKRPIEGYHCDDIVAKAEAAVGRTYAPQQREAFRLLLNGGIGIVTGGPGTGKSTVVKGLLSAYQSIFPENKIKLCAPTGRAAQRMKEVCQMEASTIHKLLEYKPYGDVITCKNETDPIDADLIIVDECSMISIDIAAMLFSAIKPGTAVIMCGDINQLPSVGPGNVLKDMIRSEVIPTVMLTKTYRQAEGSTIITNAQRIQMGIPTMLEGNDFTVITVEDDLIPEKTKELFEKYYQKDDIFALQVLSPGRRKRETGSHMMSKLLQSTFDFKNSAVLRYGDTIFHEGDKVMFTRNNYAANYFNGDMGVVKSIAGGRMNIMVEDQEIEVQEENLDDVILAYCVTIHKSQGSEFATTIIILPSEPNNMLQRQLVYTAETRPKQRCIIIAAPNAMETAVERVDAAFRQSDLANKLKSFQ